MDLLITPAVPHQSSYGACIMRSMSALACALLSLLATSVMSSDVMPQADNVIATESVKAAAMAATDESALAVNVWPMVGQAKLKVEPNSTLSMRASGSNSMICNYYVEGYQVTP